MAGGEVELTDPPSHGGNASAPITDYFELLGEPRRPWLDPEALKQKFLSLSSQAHPDRFHAAPEAERQAAGRRYVELNAAWQCLREPKERLRHLLELQLGARPPDIQRVPPELTEPFFEVGRLCREASNFLAEKARASSPVVQAQMFGRGAEWTDRLQAMQQHLNRRREDLLAELKTMNAAWDAAAEPGAPRGELPLQRLEEIYRLLGYFGRWSEQLQERIVQLAF